MVVVSEDEVISTVWFIDNAEGVAAAAAKGIVVFEDDDDDDGLTTYLPWLLKRLRTNAKEAKQLCVWNSVNGVKFWNMEEFVKDI